MQGCCCRGKFCIQYFELSWTKKKTVQLLYPSHTCTGIDYDYIVIMHCACQPRSRRVEGSFEGLGDCGTPCWDERKVRAKERGVWRRLTNRIGSGNWTNHDSCLRLCCSLFWSNSHFSYVFISFKKLLSFHLLSLLFHRYLTQSWDWASYNFYLKPTPSWGFGFGGHPALHSPRQIIIPSAVTKEMHTPSITMYKFSVRRFGWA